MSHIPRVPRPVDLDGAPFLILDEIVRWCIVVGLLRRSRVLRLLLVCGFVPLVMLTSTGVAQAVVVVPAAAAPVTSESATFDVGLPRSMNVRCGLVHGTSPGLLGGTWSVHDGGWCDQTMIPEFGAPSLAEFSYVLTLKGEYEDGESTEWNIDWNYAAIEDGWFSNRLVMGTPSAPLSNAWQAHELCLTISDSSGFDRTATDCVTSNLATAAPTDCPDAKISNPGLGNPYVLGEGNDNWWVTQFTADVEVTGEEPSEWMFYAVLDHPVVDQSGVRAYGRQVTFYTIDPAPPAFWGGVKVQLSPKWKPNYNQPQRDIDREVIGYGVAKHNGKTGAAMVRTPDVNTNGLLGLTDPSKCAFYWGEQIWDDGNPGTGTDEPVGGIDPPETPEVPTPPGEDDGDPWWLTLFKLLRDLPGKILDGLFALFVPDQFPDWSSISVDLPPGWVPEFPSVTGGACGPLAFPAVDIGMAGDVEPFEFIDTCEAPWSIARTLTYYGILGVALVVVGLRLLRVAMNALGMGVDSLGGADE